MTAIIGQNELEIETVKLSVYIHLHELILSNKMPTYLESRVSVLNNVFMFGTGRI